MNINLNQRRQGFTLMEILVVFAIIIVLAAIAFPVYGRIKATSNKNAALAVMKSLGAAVGTYAAQNDGSLPMEDSAGSDDWGTAAQPAADKAWYNALPRQLGSKSVGDFVKEGIEAAFYSKANVLFLPGANYPEGKKMTKPLFAISINSRIQRKNKEGEKGEVKLANIVNPSRTVVFLEQGLPGESPRAHDTISKKDYDGAPKGSAKSFVARYTGRGIIAFFDGHTEEVSGKDLLNDTGDIIWDETLTTTNPSAIIWTADPKEDPNKKPAQQ